MNGRKLGWPKTHKFCGNVTTGSRTVLFPVTATTGAFFRALQKVHHPKNIAGTSDGTAAGHNSFQVTTQGYEQSHLLHLAIAKQAVKPQQKKKGGGEQHNWTENFKSPYLQEKKNVQGLTCNPQGETNAQLL